ncbi:MAG: phosphoglucosamine mutase [Flavobacteriales bacterium]|jgi:phosphomannomutase|nr:phosphoglucosamine mutase [Flavobacteriales bacterium]
MTLIKSISGIRGEIGGKVNDALTPIDIVKFACSYGKWLQDRHNGKIKIVIGRDARISGPLVQSLVISSLQMMGIDVINLDLSTTPTVEMAVVWESAQGGIILTASHNPKQWNALKLLNEKGEFISAADGQRILDIASEESFDFAKVGDLGSIKTVENAIDLHIEKIMDLPLVNGDLNKKKPLKIIVDAINSTGAIAIPKTLEALGYTDVEVMFSEMHGDFEHNPEPLKDHLKALSDRIIETKADLGIVVDPDVDRLAFVCEDGSMFGEEYTLVAVADYILDHTPGNTVSNMSSTRALRDITEEKTAYKAFSSAVGEVNVVEMMKKEDAIIGGEGNGGVIYPTLHAGRDAMVGTALFLNHFVNTDKSMTEFRDQYPSYTIAKKKIQLTPQINVDAILSSMEEKYRNNYEVNTIDGVKIYIEKEWVHMRKSNTEPIIRIYAESSNEQSANNLADRFIGEIKELI